MEELQRAGRSTEGTETDGDILTGHRDLDPDAVPLNQFKQRKSDALPFERFMADQDHQLPGRLLSTAEK